MYLVLLADGSLAYPGVDGPLSSLSLDALRDGIEDWELFRRLGFDRAAKWIEQVVSNGPHCDPRQPWTDRAHRCVDWKNNPAALEAARRGAAKAVVDGMRVGGAPVEA